MQTQDSRLKTQEWAQLREEAEGIVARYEYRQAAMLPVLHLVQSRLGSISSEAEELVARCSAQPRPTSTRS